MTIESRPAEGADTADAPGLGVETATWRPLEVVDVDGWSLGASKGFTRRANSVVARRAPRRLDAAVDRVEAFYADRGQPPVFRVCAQSRPESLDRLLAERGYSISAETAVLAADLVPPAPVGVPDGVRITVHESPSREWLEGWLAVKTTTAGGVDTDVAGRILQGSPAVYLSASDQDGQVGVLRAAFEGRWVGLSCVTVQPRARRRGIARALTAAALAHARAGAAERAFLQVEQSNRAAVELYRHLGFDVVDRYHYRQR